MKKIKIKSEELIIDEQEQMKNQLARAMADYANLQKRTEEERGTMYKLASISFMSKVLPILDNLKQAQNHIKDSGIAIIIGQLENLAIEEGFEEIKLTVGDKFNEETAEVTEVLETDKELDDNSISEVVQSGWKYSDGTTVRHGRVRVYKKVNDKKENDKENKQI